MPEKTQPQKWRRPTARPLAGAEVLVPVRGPSPREGGGKKLQSRAQLATDLCFLRLRGVRWVRRVESRARQKRRRRLLEPEIFSTVCRYFAAHYLQKQYQKEKKSFSTYMAEPTLAGVEAGLQKRI